MCFDEGDCDWTASVCEDETLPATKPTRCDECGRMIEVGEPVRHIFLQEHEYCREDPEHEDYDGEETDRVGCGHATEDECDFGESSHYDRCQTCDQLLDAIYQHEIESGCKHHEAQPNLGELDNAMIYGDRDRYLAKAEQLYPGITQRLPKMFFATAGVDDDD